jgi:hypothetical protein
MFIYSHHPVCVATSNKHHKHWDFFYISPLFNQVGQLRTSSHLQLQPGQDKAKQCDKINRVTHGINKHTENNKIEGKKIYVQCVEIIEE